MGQGILGGSRYCGPRDSVGNSVLWAVKFNGQEILWADRLYGARHSIDREILRSSESVELSTCGT